MKSSKEGMNEWIGGFSHLRIERKATKEIINHFSLPSFLSLWPCKEGRKEGGAKEERGGEGDHTKSTGERLQEPNRYIHIYKVFHQSFVINLCEWSNECRKAKKMITLKERTKNPSFHFLPRCFLNIIKRKKVVLVVILGKLICIKRSNWLAQKS